MAKRYQLKITNLNEVTLQKSQLDKILVKFNNFRTLHSHVTTKEIMKNKEFN